MHKDSKIGLSSRRSIQQFDIKPQQSAKNLLAHSVYTERAKSKNKRFIMPKNVNELNKSQVSERRAPIKL